MEFGEGELDSIDGRSVNASEACAEGAFETICYDYQCVHHGMFNLLRALTHTATINNPNMCLKQMQTTLQKTKRQDPDDVSRDSIDRQKFRDSLGLAILNTLGIFCALLQNELIFAQFDSISLVVSRNIIQFYSQIPIPSRNAEQPVN